MHESRIYKTYVYLAGIQIPFVSATVSSQYGTLSSLNLELNYSPYIAHIHEFTKVQVWEQIIDSESDPMESEPTLEFDGVVVGIVRNKNVLGQVSIRLTCLTDGFIWNQRKRYDFYVDQILQAQTAEIDDLINVRADGQIDNYIANLLSENQFDIGCAVASILTSHPKGKYDGAETDKDKKLITTSFTYTYNGKEYNKKLQEVSESEAKKINPDYYNKYLDTFNLMYKIYGVTTSQNVKDFFQQDRFLKLAQNQSNDIVGENTFWNIATTVMQYGFYSIYDIPNPTYIPKNGSSNILNVDDIRGKNKDAQVELISLLKNNKYNGLAEYILKPISVLGLPLKCNIIWPEQVISESLFYDMVNSPTRIIMQMSALPITDNMAPVLTTQRVAGPVIGEGDYFSSFVPASNKKHITSDPNNSNPKIRPATIYSDYEKEYGMRYTMMNLSYAFENSLLTDLKEKGTANDIKNATRRIDNFLNYEFAQRYFAARNYSLQVTPDVDIVPGLPVIVLNKNQEHIICFCTGKSKSWSAQGSKSVSITVGYPRFYYENIDKLGNLIDPSSQEIKGIQELEALFGSKALIRDGEGPSSTPIKNIDSKTLAKKVDELFENYQNFDIDYNEFKRKTCTYSNFREFYGSPIDDSEKKVMPDSYLKEKYASSSAANSLSNHYFEANGDEFHNYPNQQIIEEHLNWISQGQRI